jgi:hypothetical protein
LAYVIGSNLHTHTLRNHKKCFCGRMDEKIILGYATGHKLLETVIVAVGSPSTCCWGPGALCQCEHVMSRLRGVVCRNFCRSVVHVVSALVPALGGVPANVNHVVSWLCGVVHCGVVHCSVTRVIGPWCLLLGLSTNTSRVVVSCVAVL